MKKIITTAIICLAATITVSAQLGNFAGKIKNKINSKVNQRIDNKIDKKIDESLDATEGKTTVAAEPAASENNAEDKNDHSITATGKFDFVPGNNILYADDFADDETGELPVNWNSSGTGEVVTLDKTAGRWLRLHKGFTYLSRNTKQFGENYTIEFDLVLQLKSNGWMYPEIFFGIFSSGDEPNTGNAFLKEQKKYSSIETKIYPAEYKGSRASLKSFLEGKPYFNSDVKSYSDLEKYYGRPVHISMQVQKERIRVWAGQEKLFDAPKAIPAGNSMNQFFLK